MQVFDQDFSVLDAFKKSSKSRDTTKTDDKLGHCSKSMDAFMQEDQIECDEVRPHACLERLTADG